VKEREQASVYLAFLRLVLGVSLLGLGQYRAGVAGHDARPLYRLADLDAAASAGRRLFERRLGGGSAPGCEPRANAANLGSSSRAGIPAALLAARSWRWCLWARHVGLARRDKTSP